MSLVRIPSHFSMEDLDGILPKVVDNGLPGDGEFLCAELNQEKRTYAIISLLVWHGFLPMAGIGMLLGKIHTSRCVLAPSEIHIGKKVRKRAKGFELRINTNWEGVVRNVQQFTYTSRPGDCWLSDDLSRAYQNMNEVEPRWRRGGVTFHSIELWDVKSQELVAGEIGYTCGSVYSSCTGFCKKDKYPGAGTVQLAVLGRWLERCGFECWDLGMEMTYKLELGGKCISRAAWATRIRSLRTREVTLAMPVGEDALATTIVAGPGSAMEGIDETGQAGSMRVDSDGRG